jgi:hypothetical protein
VVVCEDDSEPEATHVEEPGLSSPEVSSLNS